MAPFSENAGILFGEASKISRPFKWKYLKTYTKIPEFQQLMIKAVPILRSLNGIVYYSHQVVAINNSQLKYKEKNKQLARYLGDILKKAGEKGQLDSLGLSRETLNQVLENIPKADTYMEAIGEASPIVNSVVLTVQNSLDELQEDIAVVINTFDRKIETEYGDTRTILLELMALQTETMYTTTMIYRMLMGQQVSVDSVLQRDTSLKKFLSSPNLTVAQLEGAESYLLERLSNIDKVIQQMRDQVKAYHYKQDEMEEWRLNVDEKIRVARNAISVWAQSHRNLGAGIPVPPLIDVAGIAGGLVGTAANTVIP
jgi:hypothetical protein